MIEIIMKAQQGDKQALDQLVNDNMGLIKYQANRFSSPAINFDDAVQVGSIAFIKAVENFKPDMGYKFSTYAARYIEYGIWNYLKNYRDDVPSRIPVKTYENYKKLKKGEKLSTSEEIETRNIMENTLRLDKIIKISSDGKDVSIADTLENTSNISEDQLIQNIDLKNAIDKLPKREKDIINLRYFQGKRQIDISEILGIPQSNVWKIETRALKHLKNLLEGKEMRDNAVHMNKNRTLDLTTVDLSIFTPRQRTVAQLVYGQGMTQTDVARQLNTTKTNICSAIGEIFKKIEKRSIYE